MSIKANNGNPSTTRKGPGRRPAIPVEVYAMVFELYAELNGYGKVANRLAAMGLCFPSRSAVYRLLKCRGVYHKGGRRQAAR